MDARPWLAHYGDVPRTLAYPDLSLYEAVRASAQRRPTAVAYDFLDRTATYAELLADVDRCAAGLATLGLRRGESITIAMPTCPQGVIAFYAANRLGAVASMVHPLSTPDELAFYLDVSGSRFALTLDAFVPAFESARPRTALERIVVAGLGDYLGPAKRLGYWWTRGRHVPRLAPSPGRCRWRELMQEHSAPPPPAGGPDDVAAILYSGGTTGTPKGIELTNRNLLAEGLQVAAWARMREDDSLLCILPLFHGFGLGVCVNATLVGGGRAILVPTFTAETVAELIRRKRPTLLVGVPTLYAALARDPSLERADLKCLRAAFSGADTLPRPVKEAFESLVRRRGGDVRLLEGYGLTEAVSAVMAMPLDGYREGTIGVPFPDMVATICAPGTTDEVPPGVEGEICVAGPAVMKGYLRAPEETALALRAHADGRTWLHTGDLGTRDADGYFRFTCRLKRMIKSSGFNVYPAQVEAVLLQHPAVLEACVVGVPDERQVERVEAFVVLRETPGSAPAMGTGLSPDEHRLAETLIAHCRERLIKWACPRTVHFRAELPKTRVGKIDYRRLAAEAAAAEARCA